MKKLVEIQAKLKANKSQYNSFGGYAYRSCEDILEAVKPLLVEANCFITLNDDIVMLGERYYIKATATIVDAETGASISATAYAREQKDKKGMDESQLTGATSSYARKYALNGLLAIDDAKDADATNTHDKQESHNSTQKVYNNTRNSNEKVQKPAENKQKPADDKQDDKREALRLECRKLIVATDTDEASLIKHYKVNSLEEMTAPQLENAMYVMKSKLKR